MSSSGVRRCFLLALILAALALRLWQLGAMPLFSDEAYYLLWVDRLAPAYVDHPAGIALLLKVSTAWLGRTEFGVRGLNALFERGLRAAGLCSGSPLRLDVGWPVRSHCSCIRSGLHHHGACGISGHPPDGADPGESPLPGAAAGRPRDAAALGVVRIHPGPAVQHEVESAFYAVGLGIYLLGWRRDLLRQPGLWLALGLAALGLDTGHRVERGA